jgi:hypothetical protein
MSAASSARRQQSVADRMAELMAEAEPDLPDELSAVEKVERLIANAKG